MAPHLSSSVLLAMLSASVLPAALATYSPCYDSRFSAANATGSVQIPALETTNVTNSTWTVSTAVKEILVSELNNSFIVQKWSLDTTPVITTSPSQLSFTGCAFLLDLNSPSKTLLGSTDGNTCSGVFDNDCYNAILEVVNSNVSMFAANDINSVCSSMSSVLASIPSQCKKSEWGEIMATQPFGNPNFTGADTPSNYCIGDEINPLHGSATQAALISERSFSVPVGNQTYYDQAIEKITPLILTTFPKNSTQDWTPNTQLVCLRAGNIVAGSEVPNGAGSVVSKMMTRLGLLVLVAAAWSLC